MTTAGTIVLIAALAIIVVGVVVGIGPNWREVSWAIEDTVVWIAERTPLSVLFCGAYLLLIGSVGGLVWLVVW